MTHPLVVTRDDINWQSELPDTSKPPMKATLFVFR